MTVPATHPNDKLHCVNIVIKVYVCSHVLKTCFKIIMKKFNSDLDLIDLSSWRQ